ncbi:hypothetical protein BLNAU_11207 [Blattamonas nauphoetae]|uniref:Uncharacterized protein n=1 Tax=Blattamonas nauphoetae TaxID=2049346 RepID=A0ABQ9XQJ0_9EUKA|nr:hypothetical protein BLNAU_11207 [Blattamonas nauphoetae]
MPHLEQESRLIEYFAEAVIGIDIIRKKRISEPPLTLENIRIDTSSTILIDKSPIAGSLSSDIFTLCRFFLHTHPTLKE